jgi:putative sterol carrier protein
MEAGGSVPSIDPEQFAKMVGDATDEQLAQGFADNRELILGEVFRRMEEHFKPEHAKGVEAVVEWRITEAPGEGYDRWQAVIRDGACKVSRDGDENPRVTLTAAPVDFIKLVSGNASGPELFMSGKLKIEGDLMFAAQIQSLFQLPTGP